MGTEADTAFGEVRGFLEAFARFNDKWDHGCTFTFDRLPKADTLDAAIELHFRGEALKISRTPVADWPGAVRESCRVWFFQFQVTGVGHRTDPGKNFGLSNDWGREGVLDWLMARLGRVVQPSAVWKVEVETKGFYECGWDDFVFEAEGGSYFLHLGVSD